MRRNDKKCAISCYEKILDELYNTDTLVNVTITSCLEKETNCEYYGIPEKFRAMISNERNQYISLLTLISDKIKYINKLNAAFEQERLLLH